MAGYGIFLALTQAFAAWSGACGMVMTPVLATGILLISAILGTLAARAARPKLPEDATTPPLHPGAFALPVLVAVTCLALLTSAWLKPDLTYDGNATHLPTLHFWAQEGRIHWITPDFSPWSEHIRAGWNAAPKGWHAVAFTLARALGTDRLVNATNLLFLPLGFLGVAALARRLGAGRGWSLAAASLFLLVPVNLAQCTTTYGDAATTACFAGLAALAVASAASLARGMVPWKLLPGLAALAGLAPALKFTGYVFAPLALGLAAAWGLAAATRARDARAACRVLLFVAITGLGAVCIAGYWPARTWLHTGTPFYPLGVRVAGVTVFRGAEVAEALPQRFFHTPAEQVSGAEWGQARRVAWTWAQGLGRWPASIRSYGSFDGGLGYLWALGCLPALALMAWPRRGAARSAFWMTLLLAGAVFIARPGNHIARHTYWIYLAGLPAWATVAAAAWREQRPSLRRLGRTWVGVCLALALFEGGYALAYTVTRCGLRHHDWPPFLSDPAHAAASLTWHDPVGYLRPEMSGTLFEEVRRNHDPVALGVFNTEAQHLAGWLSHPLGVRPVFFLDPDVASDASTLDSWMREHRIRYVVWDGKDPLPKHLAEKSTRTDTAGIWFQIVELGAW